MKNIIEESRNHGIDLLKDLAYFCVGGLYILGKESSELNGIYNILY